MENQLSPISFEQLTKYVLGGLTDEENLAVEKIVLIEPYYMQLANNLMDYCDQEEINDVESLEIAIEGKKILLFEQLKKLESEGENPRPIKMGKEKGTYRMVLVALLLGILLAIMAYKVYNPVNEKHEREIRAEQDKTLEIRPENTAPENGEEIESAPPEDESKNKDNTPIDRPEKKTPTKSKKNNNTNTNRPIAYNFDNNYSPYELPFDDPIKVKSTGINEAYTKGAYELVIAILKKDIPNQQGFEKASSKLILAKSLLFTKQYQEATALLLKMQTQEETIRLLSRVKWFLARTYLLDDKIDSGVKLLEELLDSDCRVESAALLKRLKQDGIIN
ncbi:MAG: hypothetical protein ACI9RM_002254 [Ulvibacter sp.]|jgi:hypothetical protein